MGVFELGGAQPFHSVPATVDGTRGLISGSFRVTPGSSDFRFQVYVDPAGEVGLDDAWLTPM